MLKKLLNVFLPQVLKREYALIKLESLSCNTQYLESWLAKERNSPLVLYVESKLVPYKLHFYLIIININTNLLMNGKNKSSLVTSRHLTRFSIITLTFLTEWNIIQLL